MVIVIVGIDKNVHITITLTTLRSRYRNCLHWRLQVQHMTNIFICYTYVNIWRIVYIRAFVLLCCVYFRIPGTVECEELLIVITLFTSDLKFPTLVLFFILFNQVSIVYGILIIFYEWQVSISFII